ncbi:MAG: 30S ribosomal protein S7 [Caldisericia bacterium]|nr:30S ribosomal protein S7 [Caldisericia bacterium]
MPRKKIVLHKRERLDPVYSNKLIGKVIGKLIKDGKRLRAEQIIYNALDIVAEKTGKKPVQVMEEVVDLCRPRVEVKPRRVGGATYQIPIEVSPDRGEALAIKWIVTFSIKRKGIPMKKRLAQEMLDAYASQGGAFRKKEDTHKMAEANRAFAHYRW